LHCATGVQPFVPFATPLLRAHGDVLELDALCKQHALLSRQMAVLGSAAPVSNTSFTDAELPQVTQRAATSNANSAISSHYYIHDNAFIQAVSKLEHSIHSAQAQLERISLVAQRVCMSR
jgi:NDP-sugar pyrophosphorylase family protein